MARRITIEIKVEESSSAYSWDTLAETELTTSVELFSGPQTAAALVAGVEELLGLAAVESAARAQDPVFQRQSVPLLPDLDDVLDESTSVPA